MRQVKLRQDTRIGLPHYVFNKLFNRYREEIVNPQTKATKATKPKR